MSDTGGAPLPAGTGRGAARHRFRRAVNRGRQTAADGSYALTDVAAGDYVLRVGAPGIEAGIQVADGAAAAASTW